MTKKLEELFGFPPSGNQDLDQRDSVAKAVDATEEIIPSLTESLAQLDKIELALPAVRGLESSDGEMDELAGRAVKEFDNLMDLGMQVDSRYASEIFSVASTMLGHAITAKNAKINKKLKMIELQMKKLKLDQDTGASDNIPTGQGTVLDRNELLNRLIGKNSADAPKS